MKLVTAIHLLLSAAACAEGPTALEALKLLPKEGARNLARIEAREGTPDPERWYLLTHDEKAENGLREYVVAGGEVVASRNLSQFAESVQPEDVIGGDAVKFDSDKAAKLAQQYALANNVTVAALHYELRKDGPAAVPLWTVICADEAGTELARLVVTASKGTVISHDGFAAEPPPPVPKPKPKVKTQATAIVEADRDPEIRRPLEARPPEEVAEKKPGFFQRLGRTLTGKKEPER